MVVSSLAKGGGGVVVVELDKHSLWKLVEASFCVWLPLHCAVLLQQLLPVCLLHKCECSGGECFSNWAKLARLSLAYPPFDE